MKKLLLTVVITLFIFAGSSALVFAQGPDPDGVGVGPPGPDPDGEEVSPPGAEGDGIGALQNPLQFESIPEFFKAVIDVVTIFAVPIIVFFIIYAGFLYVTAQGSEEKIKKATTAFTWAIVGGLLVLGAQVLIDVIQGTVNAIT